MSIDAISALARALSFIALFQAAGVAITVAMFGRLLDRSAEPIRRVGFLSAIAGLVLVFVHYALEAARMAGALSGVLDMSLQDLVLDSSMSVAAGLRLLGLALIAGSIRREGTVAMLRPPSARYVSLLPSPSSVTRPMKISRNGLRPP